MSQSLSFSLCSKYYPLKTILLFASSTIFLLRVEVWVQDRSCLEDWRSAKEDVWVISLAEDDCGWQQIWNRFNDFLDNKDFTVLNHSPVPFEIQGLSKACSQEVLKSKTFLTTDRNDLSFNLLQSKVVNPVWFCILCDFWQQWCCLKYESKTWIQLEWQDTPVFVNFLCLFFCTWTWPWNSKVEANENLHFRRNHRIHSMFWKNVKLESPRFRFKWADGGVGGVFPDRV